MAADHMTPGDRAKWLARQREEAAKYASSTSDAIRRTRVARGMLDELVEAARGVEVSTAHARGLIDRIRAERAWLAVDREGGRE